MVAPLLENLLDQLFLSGFVTTYEFNLDAVLCRQSFRVFAKLITEWFCEFRIIENPVSCSASDIPSFPSAKQIPGNVP